LPIIVYGFLSQEENINTEREVNEMIDSINSVSLQHITNSLSQSSRINKDKSSSLTELKSPEVKSPSIQDSISSNFDLNGDLQTLQNSVRTVYDQVKQQLQEYYGLSSDEEAIADSAMLPPEDASAQDLVEFFSPENTASRIVDFATNFLGAYQGNHPDDSENDQVNQFTTMIGEAIKQGFDEAEDILGSFDELGEIGDNIQKTYDLVLTGLEEFRLSHFNDGVIQEEIEDTAAEEISSQSTGELDIVG